MTKGRLSIVLGAAACLVLGLAAAADVPLPNGYAIVETQPNERVIVRGADVIVFGAVDLYAVSGDVVVGTVSRPPAPRAEPGYYDDVRVGHFLLDTKSGALVAGLDRHSWDEVLRRFGIQSAPALKPPCSSDKPKT